MSDFFTLELDAGRVVEIVCCKPGPLDGALLGYAIQFGGTWDAWQIQHRCTA